MTAVHLPSNHSHRDNRSKTKDIHISKIKKLKKKETKEKYTDTRTDIARYRWKKKKREKGKAPQASCKRSQSFLSSFIWSLLWIGQLDEKLIDKMYLSLLCFFFFSFVSVLLYTRTHA